MQSFNNGSFVNVDRHTSLGIWTKESETSLKNRFILFQNRITFANSDWKYAIVGT
jgi:hypothetical protein